MTESNQDWYVGEDPGFTTWFVVGGDGAMITSTDSDWTVTVYDTTSATPETALTPSATPTDHDEYTGSNAYFLQSATVVTDGYWTGGGAGYNWRAFVPDAGYQEAGSTFVAGHEYRFVWTVDTGAYDAAANHWGTIVLVRTGRCLPKK
jgi:hypothetical protein